MPRSIIYLSDVNVWLALASERHVHARICGHWVTSLDSDELMFCRVTQMALLRLLTHESVMGNDVLSSREAWRVYWRMFTDERVQFAPEPFALEEEWRKLTSHSQPAPKIWTDAYLVAFARSSGSKLVTLDQAMLSLAPDSLILS